MSKKMPKASVLMIGPRRVGKSSVLASMLRSLQLMKDSVGIQFTPDSTTTQLMQEKLADLNRIFVEHGPEDVFETQSGEVNGQVYAASTDERITYHFTLSASAIQKKGKKEKEVREDICEVEFSDILGEDMTNQQEELIDRMQKSSVILLAIDSVALMEEGITGNSWNERINFPAQIYNMFVDAYSSTEQYTPQLVLMVPLKCEKYYWEKGGMDCLNEKIKESYRDLITFFESRPAFSVAITPILTLGDVIFSHYDNVQRYAPLYTFRTLDEHGLSIVPNYTPMFCNQPLCYIAGFILSLENQIKQEKAKKQGNGWKRWGTRFVVVVLGGLTGLVLFEVFSHILKKPEIRLQMEKLAASMKTTGDGYEFLQDNMGIQRLCGQIVLSLPEAEGGNS